MSPRPDRVGRGEKPERRVRADHLVLVQERHAALGLEDALDHEHHVGAPGVVLVEHQGHRSLQRPGQEPLAVLGDLLAVPQHDRILADQVDPADVAVEIDADAGPVEPRRHLLDMGRLARAVIALDQDAAVVREARQDRQRRVVVELVGGIDIGDVGGPAGEGRHLELRLDAEGLCHGKPRVGPLRQLQQVVELVLHGLGNHNRDSRNERLDEPGLCPRASPSDKVDTVIGDRQADQRDGRGGMPPGSTAQAYSSLSIRYL